MVDVPEPKGLSMSLDEMIAENRLSRGKPRIHAKRGVNVRRSSLRLKQNMFMKRAAARSPARQSYHNNCGHNNTGQGTVTPRRLYYRRYTPRQHKQNQRTRSPHHYRSNFQTPSNQLQRYYRQYQQAIGGGTGDRHQSHGSHGSHTSHGSHRSRGASSSDGNEVVYEELELTYKAGTCVPVFTSWEQGRQHGRQGLSVGVSTSPSALPFPPSSSPVDEDLAVMLQYMPRHLVNAITTTLLMEGASDHGPLVEVVMDEGRPVTLRFRDNHEEDMPFNGEMDAALHALGAESEDFGPGNRLGISSTLHRISAMRGRDSDIAGLTYRVGRHMQGVANLLLDVLANIAKGGSKGVATEHLSTSLLLLGPPGVGKTTLLRDVAHSFANRFNKRVVVVDTSNEIAGDGRVAHKCIGRARRMAIPHGRQQHNVLVEAVQNHNPEVLVVDEIGTSREVAAVRSIAQRGVILCGTAHGVMLRSLVSNPELNQLVGGVHSVIVGDAEARRNNHGTKTRRERVGKPAFSTLVEVLDHDTWRIHLNVAHSVDALLAGQPITTQLRQYRAGRMMVRFERGQL